MASKTILQWNCRGLRSNYSDLDVLFNTFSPAVVCLQETLQSDQNLSNFRHFTQIFKNATKIDGRPNGGVAILIKNSIPHSTIQLNSNLQATAARITLHKLITICSIYLPPTTTFNQNELTDLLLQLPSPVLLMGDFNGHNPLWGGSTLDTRGKLVEDFVNNNNLCVLNDRSSTFLSSATGSRSSIDLTICDPSLMLDLAWSVYDDLCGSDHYPIVTKINKPTCHPSVQRWKLQKADWPAYHDLCEQYLNNFNFSDINDPMDLFTTQLLTIAEKTIPKTKATPQHLTKPWFNENCKAAISDRKRALKQFTLQPTTNNLINFKMVRAKTRRLIRETKRLSWQNYVSGLNSRTTVKKAWDMVRKISGKVSQTPLRHLKTNNTLITDITTITNTLAKTFSDNSSSNHYSPTFQQFKTIQEQQTINFRSQNLEPYNILFSLEELNSALRASHDTSPGPDNIPYQFIQHLPFTSLKILLNLFNNIWTGGTFPSKWQQATIIPLPKPDKDHSDPNSYRPIALTSCLCKTMERMVNNRLVYYLESNNIITNIQSGFRQQRSTTDQLVRLETWIREGLANREHVVAVFFDLEKAYDTTWKHGILSDLFKAGLRGYLPQFVAKFLNNRQFRVRVGSALSDHFCQENGVPQGSILSVTLFNLKINNIATCTKPGTESSLYVDDFLACVRSQQMRSIERQLQVCLNNLQRWSEENGFKFSESKTVCMHFCNKRSVHPDPVLLLNKQPIPIVNETKFLGIIFDNKLSFIPHLHSLKTKCSKAMNLLKVVSHRDWGGDTSTLLKLYRSLIRSKLDYGAVVYGSARKSYIQMLDPIQNQALRLCLGAFRTSPVESLQVEANEPPLSSRRNKLSIQYAVKLKSNTSNPTYNSTFDLNYKILFDNRPKTIPPFGIRVSALLNEMKLDLAVIAQSQFASLEPWTLCLPEVSFQLHTDKKSSVNPVILKSQFYSYLSNDVDSFHIYTDGSKDNGSVAAAAVCTGKTLSCRLPSTSSIFSAEAVAILLALDIIESANHKSFKIFSDSMSCLQAIKYQKLKNPTILKILEKCHYLHLTQKTITFCWLPSHVGIRGNENADMAAKAALLLPISANIKIPYTDLKQSIHTFFTSLWQDHWNTTPFNKLQSIKPKLGQTVLHKITSRRDEVVLHRARIGHTNVTHSYLLKHENNTDCSSCNCLLTVQHILIDCPAYAVIRNKHYNVTSLLELFNKLQPLQIINFLKEIKLYNSF